MTKIDGWSNWETFVAWEVMNTDTNTVAKINKLNRWWNISIKRKAFNRENALKIVESNLFPVLKKYNVQIERKKVNKNEIVQKIINI